MNKGFGGPLDNTHKVVETISVGTSGSLMKANTGKTMIGLRSNSKSANNPTSDTDDYGLPGGYLPDDNKIFGSKMGQATLDGAHGNGRNSN